MTDQNNAAQPGLTDDLKDAVNILRALRGYLKSHRINGPTMLCTDGKALNNADDEVLRALKLLVPLSKLRAEGVQAGDERETFEEWDRLFTAYCGAAQGVDAGKAANALVAFTRAALASAPVAGEVRPSDADILALFGRELGAHADGRGYDAGVISFARALLSRYAAPQASEAVPKPIAVARHSDQSVLLAFSSCRLASVFERTIQPQIDQAHKDLIAHGVSIQRIEPADFLALQADKDGAQSPANRLESRASIESKGGALDGGDCAKGAGDEPTPFAPDWANYRQGWADGLAEGNEAIDIARTALMEIADLADVEADQRGGIVNEALTRIDEITARAALAAQKHPRTDGGGRG